MYTVYRSITSAPKSRARLVQQVKSLVPPSRASPDVLRSPTTAHRAKPECSSRVAEPLAPLNHASTIIHEPTLVMPHAVKPRGAGRQGVGGIGVLVEMPSNIKFLQSESLRIKECVSSSRAEGGRKEWMPAGR